MISLLIQIENLIQMQCKMFINKK